MAHAPMIAPPQAEQRIAMTYEEWLARPDTESKQTEWVDGEVIVFVPPKWFHQDALGFLHILLRLYARFFDLGAVVAAPFEMRLSDRSSREPDLLFVARDHLDRLTVERLIGPADLAVELVSESSVRRDRLEKFAEYALAGVPEYWLLDPRPGRQRSEFYRLSDEGTYEAVPLDADGRYHAAVLPNFWFRPDWLWQDPLPDPLVCLQEIAPAMFVHPPAPAPVPRSDNA